MEFGNQWIPQQFCWFLFVTTYFYGKVDQSDLFFNKYGHTFKIYILFSVLQFYGRIPWNTFGILGFHGRYVNPQ